MGGARHVSAPQSKGKTNDDRPLLLDALTRGPGRQSTRLEPQGVMDGGSLQGSALRLARPELYDLYLRRGLEPRGVSLARRLCEEER